MVAVLANIIEIIVLSSGTNAFLRVDGTLESCEIRIWVNGAEEYLLVPLFKISVLFRRVPLAA
jgi:hypothetical protein